MRYLTRRAMLLAEYDPTIITGLHKVAEDGNTGQQYGSRRSASPVHAGISGRRVLRRWADLRSGPQAKIAASFLKEFFDVHGQSV